MALCFALAIFFAFFLSCSLCGVIRVFAPKVGLVDKPGYRKIHETVMPTGGGLGIWLGVLTPIAVGLAAAYCLAQKGGDGPETVTLFGFTIPEFAREHAPGVVFQAKKLCALLGLGTVLVALGTLDDRFGLGWKLRLGVQTLVAAAAVAFGWEATFFVSLPWLTKIISVIWIVGLINSFNMLDNMDGLSGGVAAICAGFLAAVMLLFTSNDLSGEPQLFLGGFLLLLVGAILGFLVHNRPPAKMFMGDGGAYFIGFLLATTTLSATFVGSNAPKQAILVPLCILAVPLYDTASVILIRLKNGKSPFEGDKNHYSHRLVEIGLSKAQAVGTIYLTTAICGVSALYLYEVSASMAFLVIAQIGMMLALVGILEFTARRKMRGE